MSSQVKRDGAQVIHRAAVLLREVASSREAGMTLADLARNTGLPRGTAHRILAALASEGLLEKSPGAGYRLGSMLSELGLTNSIARRIEAAAHPMIQDLATSMEAHALFNLQSGDDAVCIDSCDGSRFRRRLPMRTGNRRPLGVGSASMAILASLPADQIEAIAMRNTGRYRRYGLSPDGIILAARRAAERGYAISTGRFVPGYRGISIGIVFPGWKIGSVTISDLTSRLEKEKLEQTLDVLHRAARDLRGGLGDVAMTSSRSAD